jgi:hypothetical protein
MPSRRLANAAMLVHRYDLVGSYSDTTAGFVRHVGMVDPGESNVYRGAGVTVAHMGPPIEKDGEMAVDVVGSAGVTAEEAMQIQIFIDGHYLEHESLRLSKQAAYVIRPHVQKRLSTDGTRRYTRFNCVGFVIEAYRDAGIDILITDESQLPDVSLEKLKSAYPDLAKDGAAKLNMRYEWGCDGSGPWRVVLPGYLFHALHNVIPGARGSIPYVPQAGDERFF